MVMMMVAVAMAMATMVIMMMLLLVMLLVMLVSYMCFLTGKGGQRDGKPDGHVGHEGNDASCYACGRENGDAG
eukprot:8541405-Alexandrium_andersonii.AAC.1